MRWPAEGPIFPGAAEQSGYVVNVAAYACGIHVACLRVMLQEHMFSERLKANGSDRFVLSPIPAPDSTLTRSRAESRYCILGSNLRSSSSRYSLLHQGRISFIHFRLGNHTCQYSAMLWRSLRGPTREISVTQSSATTTRVCLSNGALLRSTW